MQKSSRSTYRVAQPLIYDTLASYYSRAGQSTKAKAARDKGKSLMAP